MAPDATIHKVLNRSRCGDEQATAQILPMVYDELRDLARAMMTSERTGHTLQPTAVVNEACLKLISSESSMEHENRLHFFRLAAREMRRVLIEHARSRNRLKREGQHDRVPLADITLVIEENTIDLLSLEEALTRLAEIDPAKAEIVEMRYFGGLTNAEIAEIQDVTTRTVERKWEVARRRLLVLIDGRATGAE